jgi:Domain of unknown function (DUF4062)
MRCRHAMRLFVSSTFAALRAERHAAAEALRRSQLVHRVMELFLSEPSSPLDVSLRALRLSDAVVLIIGFYAGSLIPEAHGLTYTGAELQLDQQLGKPGFAFFKTEGGKPLNKETNAEKRKALDDFKGAVKAANITPAYSIPRSGCKWNCCSRWKNGTRRGDRAAASSSPRLRNSSRSLNPTRPGSLTSSKRCAVATHRLQP